MLVVSDMSLPDEQIEDLIVVFPNRFLALQQKSHESFFFLLLEEKKKWKKLRHPHIANNVILFSRASGTVSSSSSLSALPKMEQFFIAPLSPERIKAVVRK